MPTNKYEIRSDEMQEIMQKLPNTFVIWGNFLVLVFLMFIFFCLNKFNVIDTMHAPVKIIDISRSSLTSDSLCITVAINNDHKLPVKSNEYVTVYIKNGQEKPIDVLKGKIYKVEHTVYYESIIFFTTKASKITKENMIGTMEIVTAKKSFLSNMFEGILNN